jgi:hypothetical protein
MLVGALLPAASQETGEAALSFRACEYNSRGFDKDVDTSGPDRFSEGDYSLFYDPLFEPGSGDRIGREAGTLFFVKEVGQRDAVVHITVTFLFDDGRIAAQGFTKFRNLRDGVTIPITGGTRAYRGASGHVEAREGGKCNGKRALRLRFEVFS